MSANVVLRRRVGLIVLVALMLTFIPQLSTKSQELAVLRSVNRQDGTQKVITPATAAMLTELKRVSVTLDGYEGFNARVNASWAISPDGKTLALVTGKTIRMCAVESFTQIDDCTLLGEDTIIARHLSFTADGRLVIVGDFLSVLIYKDGVQEYLEHPEPMKDREATLRQTSAVEFTLDGMYFVATQPKSLIIYDVAAHSIAAEYTWESLGIRLPGFSHITVSADRSMITLDNGSKVNVIQLRDGSVFSSGEVSHRYKSETLRAGMITPDGATLAGVGSRYVMFWDKDKLSATPITIELDKDVRNRGIASSPDGRLLVAYGADGLFIFDASTREIVKTLAQSAVSVKFSADGSTLGVYDSESATLVVYGLP